MDLITNILNNIISFIDFWIYALNGVSIEKVAIAFLIFSLIPFLISRYFEHIFFRIIIIFILLSTLHTVPQDPKVILSDPDFWIWFGIFLGQLQYYIELLKAVKHHISEAFISLKNTTANIYYFFLTIFFKLVRFTRAVIRFFKALKRFFTNISFDNLKRKFKEFERDNNFREYARKQGFSNKDYNDFKKNHKEDYDRYSSFFDEDERTEQSHQESNYNNQYQEQSQRAYEEAYQKEQQKHKQQQEEHRRKEQYSEEERERQRREYEEQVKKQQEKERQEREKEKNNIPKEFRQFFSDDPYVVLGVSKNDDKKTIKKQWLKLLSKYHQDLNCKTKEDEIFFKRITQNINEAYDQIG
jgi:DnaJ-domain-containing protein 1